MEPIEHVSSIVDFPKTFYWGYTKPVTEIKILQIDGILIEGSSLRVTGVLSPLKENGYTPRCIKKIQVHFLKNKSDM